MLDRIADQLHDGPHRFLEAFNAKAAIESPGELDEEPSPTSDAEIAPPM